MSKKKKTLLGDVGFSTKTLNVIRNGISITEYHTGHRNIVYAEYAEDLTQLTAQAILGSKNISYKGLHEIVYKLNKLDLHLKDGTTLREIEEKMKSTYNRDLLPIDKLEDFKLYLDKIGVPHRPGDPYQQALQVYVLGWKPIFKKSMSKFFTITDKLIPIVEDFIKELR